MINKQEVIEKINNITARETFMSEIIWVKRDEVIDIVKQLDEPEDYSWGASKDWLPKSKEFQEWEALGRSLAQGEIAIYLLFDNWEDK